MLKMQGPQARVDHKIKQPIRSNTNSSCKEGRVQIISTPKLLWRLYRKMQQQTRIVKLVPQLQHAQTSRIPKKGLELSMTISKRKAQTSYWIHLASRWITQALTSQNKLNKDWTTLEDQVEPSMVHLDQTKIACTQMLLAINRSRWLDLRRTHRFSLQKVASLPINLASLHQMSISKTRAKTNK